MPILACTTREVRRRNRAEGPTEDGNEGSGGAVGGSHFLQELSRHQTGPENLACVIASRRFQVEREEGMEEVVGQKGEQQETFDGIGVMAKDVIGMPLLGELLESVVLDIPALVAENHGALGRKLGRRRGGHPDLWMRSPVITTNAGLRRLAVAMANSKLTVSCSKLASYTEYWQRPASIKGFSPGFCNSL
jgi:hypothetical protein